LLDNLAGLYRATDRYAEAEPLIKRVLAIQEKELPVHHPHLRTTLRNYALLLDELGRSDEAAQLRTRAEAREAAL